MRIYKGLSELTKLISDPLNDRYDHNVTHESRVTGMYAKVICLTPGCKFEVWFKPTNRN
jgi:hypothetical protein